MEINKTCNLFLRNIYLYDITACHYTILERLGHDVSMLDKDDKLKRNTQIGLMIRDNERIGNLLRSITNSTIDEYLLRNNIGEEDLIIRQYDGIIVKKLLQETTDLHIPLDLQSFFQVMLISYDRQMYISLDSNEKVSIKGVPNRYDKMNELYKRLIKINYGSKSAVFLSLQKIKDIILTGEDPLLYCIPTREDKYNVFLKRYGETEISTGVAKLLDTEDIDKELYFNFYIKPFTESICIEFM